MKKGIRRLLKYRDIALMSLPGVLLIFLFNYLPLFGLILPFKNYKFSLGIWKSPWVGLRNFEFLFSTGGAFRITRNVVLLNLGFILTTLVVSITLALLLNELGKKSVRVYQTAMFIPYLISWVVASYILFALLDMESGLVNTLLRSFGQEEVLWYNKPEFWPAILTLSNLWKGAGYSMIIYYAGLMAIDREYYEAAEIDGASRVQQMRYISIPLIMPLISMLFLLSIGRIFFGNFDLFFNLTRNSELLYETTDIIDTYVYRALRTSGDIGMASAAGFYQTIVGFFIVILCNWLVRRTSPENSLF